MIHVSFDACDEEDEVTVDLGAIDKLLNVAGIYSLSCLKTPSTYTITHFWADVGAWDAHLDVILLDFHLVARTGSYARAVVHHKVMWAFFDTEGSVCVFGFRVVLKLEGCWIVDEWLRTLCHTSSTVIKVRTREAVGVFGSETATCTLAMTTVTDVRTETSSITLFCTYRLC